MVLRKLTFIDKYYTKKINTFLMKDCCADKWTKINKIQSV